MCHLYRYGCRITSSCTRTKTELNNTPLCLQIAPSLTLPLGWVKIGQCSSLSLTKPNLTVVNPARESSLCNNSCDLITFFVASSVLLGTKFLVGSSRRTLQPSTRLPQPHWGRNKLGIGFLQPVPIRGCSRRVCSSLSGRGITAFAETQLFAAESPGASSFLHEGESYFALLTSLGEDEAENPSVTEVNK